MEWTGLCDETKATSLAIDDDAEDLQFLSMPSKDVECREMKSDELQKPDIIYLDCFRS